MSIYFLFSLLDCTDGLRGWWARHCLFVSLVSLGVHALVIRALKKSMSWDEVRFGREYDLNEFNIVTVDDFNMGAMENKGKPLVSLFVFFCGLFSFRVEARFFACEIDVNEMNPFPTTGLNIFNTKYILASPETATDVDYVNIERVIAHEYFHNWTGNRITCREWFELSLKGKLNHNHSNNKHSAQANDQLVLLYWNFYYLSICRGINCVS